LTINVNTIKLLYSSLAKRPNKIVFFPGEPFQPVLIYAGKVMNLKGASLWLAQAILKNYRLTFAVKVLSLKGVHSGWF
jgi:hypothetical protein